MVHFNAWFWAQVSSDFQQSQMKFPATRHHQQLCDGSYEVATSQHESHWLKSTYEVIPFHSLSVFHWDDNVLINTQSSRPFVLRHECLSISTISHLPSWQWMSRDWPRWKGESTPRLVMQAFKWCGTILSANEGGTNRTHYGICWQWSRSADAINVAPPHLKTGNEYDLMQRPSAPITMDHLSLLGIRRKSHSGEINFCCCLLKASDRFTIGAKIKWERSSCPINETGHAQGSSVFLSLKPKSSCLSWCQLAIWQLISFLEP